MDSFLSIFVAATSKNEAELGLPAQSESAVKVLVRTKSIPLRKPIQPNSAMERSHSSLRRTGSPASQNLRQILRFSVCTH
jgi:hypothetical protein